MENLPTSALCVFLHCNKTSLHPMPASALFCHSPAWATGIPGPAQGPASQAIVVSQPQQQSQASLLLRSSGYTHGPTAELLEPRLKALAPFPEGHSALRHLQTSSLHAHQWLCTGGWRRPGAMAAVAPALCAALTLLDALQEKGDRRPPLPFPIPFPSFDFPFSPPLFHSLMPYSTLTSSSSPYTAAYSLFFFPFLLFFS